MTPTLQPSGTLADLGQKVKGKYPGQYDDLDNADLGRRIQAKFPGQYDDFSGDSIPAAPEQPSAASRFGSSFAQTTGIPQIADQAKAEAEQPQPDSLWGTVKKGVSDAISNSPPVVAARLGKAIYQQSKQQLGKAYDAATNGDYPGQPLSDRMLEAAGHVGAAALPVLGPMAAHAGEQIGSGDVAGGLGTAAGTIAQVAGPDLVQGAIQGSARAAKSLGSLGAEVLGKTTGAGSTAIRQAASDPSPELIQQMRNPNEMEVLSNLKSAVQDVKDSRAAAYTQKLPALNSPNAPPVDPTPIRAALDQKLADFRVNKIPPLPNNPSLRPQWIQQYGVKANPAGELDFSGSPLGDADQAVVSKANDLVANWKDWSPAGGDALKRRLDALNSESSGARALLTPVRTEVKNGVTAAVPDYGTMTKDYANASQFLDQLNDLSLNSKNPGTAIRKITTTLNQNNNYRQTLIDSLQQYSGKDLKGDIAGLALSKLAPRGIMGPASGAGIMYGLLTGHASPAGAAALALTSPRLMGELAVALGKVKPLLASAVDTASGAIAPAAVAARAAGVAGNTLPNRKQTQMPAPGQ